MALGYSKRVWPLLRKQCSVDGAGVRTIIEGTLLAAVTLSANDELILLAIQYCASENGEESKLFMTYLHQDFPGLRLVYQDAGSALILVCEAIGVTWRRCVQHLSKNVTKQFAGTPKGLIDKLFWLARATTKALFDTRIQEMRTEFPKCLPAIAYIIEH